MITLTITNWDKYNPKRDQASYTWLRLNNDFYFSADLFSLDSTEKLIWIVLLCHASKANSSKIIVRPDFIAHNLRIDVDQVLQAIEKIVELQLATTCDRIRPPTTPTNERTNVTNETNVSAPPVATARPEKALNKKIWTAYKEAYLDRYGTAPVQNGKVNSQVSQLAKRLGEEAPDVVRFYVGHSKAFYVQKAHEIGLCLADAEGLRTQWATGNKITTKLAQQTDNGATLSDQLKRIREGKL